MNSLFLSRIPIVDEEIDGDSSESTADLYASLRSLFAKRWAFRRVVTLMVLSIGIGMIYYGMPLGVGSMGFDTYLSVAFNALSEIPSFVLTFFFIGRWDRKPSLLAFSWISGTCSILCVVVGSKWVQIGFELASFFSGITAFSILVIYTMELFPTSVRNSATSMVRQASVFGGMLSPVLISAGRDNNGFVSYGVFGIVIILCGLFVFSLPETRGDTMCDTMEEQERKDNNTGGTIRNGICTGV